MSNFGPFSYFYSDLPRFLACELQIDRKTFLFFFPCFFFFDFEKSRVQKMFSFLAAFFAVLLLREKQKKPFVDLSFLK